MTEFDVAEGAIIKSIKTFTAGRDVPVSRITAVSEDFVANILIWGEDALLDWHGWEGFRLGPIDASRRIDGSWDLKIQARKGGTRLTQNLGIGNGGRLVWASIDLRPGDFDD